MQPFEFLKYVKGDNCGDCNYSTCLAFSVAVTKGGVRPEECPYIDNSVLSGLTFSNDNNDEGLDRVDKALAEKDLALVAHLKERTKPLDFKKVAVNIEATWTDSEPDTLCFRYLASEVRIDKNGILLDNNKVDDPRDQILLYNFLHYCGSGANLTGKWIGMESMANAISKIKTLNTYCEEKIANHFSARIDDLSSCMKKTGAQIVNNKDKGCDGFFLVNILPMLPVQLIFWDEDKEENFPPKVKVLFDKNALDILDLESLVFAAERMAEKLIECDGE